MDSDTTTGAVPDLAGDDGEAVGPDAGSHSAGPGTLEPGPTTGDAAVDDLLEDVAAARTGDLGQRIAAGERAHERLEERLRDLGGS